MRVLTRLMCLMLAGGLLLGAPQLACAAAKDAGPPTKNGIYIGYQECPAQSCAPKARWRLLDRTPLYAAENSIRVIGWVPRCTTVITQKGEGLVVPRRGRVTKASAALKEGDVIYLLESAGEGDVTFWRNGTIEEMGFRDDESTIEWDNYGLPEPPNVWWQEVRLPDGRVGWLRNPTHLDEAGDDPSCKAAKR